MHLECFQKQSEGRRDPCVGEREDGMAGADQGRESAVGSENEVSAGASKRMGNSICLEEKK